MTVQIPVRIPEEDAEALDAAVARGDYASRSDAIRQAIDLLLKKLRDDEIADEYRRAYAEHPQEEWIGELGIWALTEIVTAEERESERGAEQPGAQQA
jgi:Arc/MetJ-type ribon-helix-helix transcriptional regulator